jgi:hypothetical protein
MALPRLLAMLMIGASLIGCTPPPFGAMDQNAPRAAPKTTTEHDAFLNRLLGKWEMIGTVMGKSVRYAANGERVLQDGFIRIHMTDVASPSQYEADLYLGFDPHEHDYVAHWLDKFGAAGARVVATGHRDGNRLILQFPYARGAFRNTWTLLDHERCRLLIEAQEQDGSWSTFADYRLTRSRSQ